MAAARGKARSKPDVKEKAEIDVLVIKRERMTLCVLGRTPIIMNRMSEKAKHQLILPKRKNRTERETTLKHDPIAEFGAAAYRIPDPGAPTLLGMPSTAFKKAIAAAALDIPGAQKTQIGRLTWVLGEKVQVYGIPKLLMSVVRSADMNKTPDIRTRVIVPEWACYVPIEYITPNLNSKVVGNLSAASGMLCGVGDWRPQKGANNYGQFDLVTETDPRFKAILAQGGRIEQSMAMEKAEPYDDETAEMLSWFVEELDRRGRAKEAMQQGNGDDVNGSDVDEDEEE